jgi:16S rRNA (uracil1498-N3)-methyltransferase
MRTARFFVPAEWVAIGAQAFSIPAGSLHKQITTVLRLKVGDAINLLTNDGQEFEAQITQITRSSILGDLTKTWPAIKPEPDLMLCAAVTKKDTFEWTLQKGTELGVSKFIPLITDRVIKRPDSVSKRWLDIIREASEQSGRRTLPSILEPMSLTAAISATNQCTQILLSETGGKSWPKLHSSTCAAIFIGPEGGFSDKEIQLAETKKLHLVTLGNLVLRAETAAIVGVTLLRFR